MRNGVSDNFPADAPFDQATALTDRVRGDGRLTSIREYIDTQALARASQTDVSGLA
jgi:ketosteroid isomerase-like protein